MKFIIVGTQDNLILSTNLLYSGWMRNLNGRKNVNHQTSNIHLVTMKSETFAGNLKFVKSEIPLYNYPDRLSH